MAPPRKITKPFIVFPSQAVAARRRVIGIDPSLSCTGICVLEGTNCTLASLSSPHDGPKRLYHLFDLLSVALREHRPTLAVLEGYSYGSSHNREALAEWGGLIRYALWFYQIPTLVVAPQTLKKFILPDTNKGVQKDQMLLASFKKWGREFANSDECDAHALAQLGSVRMRLEANSPDCRHISQREFEAAMKAAPLIYPADIHPAEAERSTGPIRRRSAASKPA